MTGTDVAELIAEARQAVEGHAPTESEVLAYRLADALEALMAERDAAAAVTEEVRVAAFWEAVEAKALEYHDRECLFQKERNELAAVIEKAQDAFRRPYENTTQPNSRMTAVQGILAAAPADVLRDVKAQAWDEGHAAGLWAAQFRERAKDNPYREGSE